MNEKKAPEIRFKGFTDDWEQRKFSDVVEIGSGMDYKHLGEGDIPVYGTGGYMLSVDSALSEEKDAIGIGRKGTIDKPYILRAPFWTVDTLFYCIPKENHDLDFINCLFQTVDWKKKDESTGVPSLSKVIINNVEAVVPSFDEQKKIGEYFNTLDHLITLHQRKHKKLLSVKKSMLEKMFPQNGAKVPEIRFEGFTDDWEQRKFPEFVEFYNGLTYSPDDVRESGTLVLRSSNVKNGEIVDVDNVYVDPEKATSENVKDGDIIVVVRNGSRSLIGKHAEIKGDKPDTVIGAFMSGIRSEHSSFVNALLDTSQFEKEIEKNMGATINQITGYMFSKMEFMIPSSKEQEVIGKYFKSIDNLITLHQRELDKLVNIKKSMLEKMFV